MNSIIDEDYDEFLENMVRYNYEREEGSFYAFKLFMDNMPYDILPDETKIYMKNLTRNSISKPDNIDSRMVKEDNDIFWEESEKTIPSDEIIFEKNADYDKISTFWMPPNYKSRGIPADLIFNKTVPLTDVVCHFKDFARDENNKPIDISFRIFLYEGWKEIVDIVKDRPGRIGLIGGVIPNFSFETKKKKKQKQWKIGFPITICSEADFLINFNMAYKNCPREKLKIFPIHEIHMWNTTVLSVFYGIQLALMNPITERVFAKQRETPISERQFTIGKKQKERKVVYVKKYYIHESDITNAIDQYRTHDMRCPLWFVQGHKRKYKSGKTIWIQGYWKGELRNKINELNKEQSENLRQRLIDMRSVNNY